MELLARFKEYLFSQTDKPSNVTVKNYISDVNHFVRWYESHYQKPFAPQLVTTGTIDTYKSEMISTDDQRISADSNQRLSSRSLERHLSSLRKFFKFLKLDEQISTNPFEMVYSQSSIVSADPYRLKDFKNFLYVYNASHLTIKNYIIDIRQFFAWAEKVLATNEVFDLKDKNILEKIDFNLLEEYKTRLINEGNFSPSTINRKLSSLRKYLSWAQVEGLVSGISYDVSSIQKQQATDLREFAYKFQDEAKIAESADTKYSSFPPIRLLQKISKIGIFAFDQLLTLPFAKAFDKATYLTWLAKGRPVFKKVSGISYNVSRIKSARSFSVDNILNTKYKILNTAPKVKNLPKEFYAPLDISTKYFPWYKKAWFTLRYKRPKWYATYHSYAITHYFHFAILIIFMAVIGFGFYQSFFQKPQTGQPALAAIPAAPLRILSFQGRLTDNLDNPISTPSALRFAIYNAQTPATGSALLWQEVDAVSPDQDGIFSVLLGNAGMCAVGQTNPTGPCGIPDWLFASNSALFLGVSVNTTPEMTPRQQLATVAFAANSETLQGLLPITGAGAGTTNVVLALDSSGNLTIGGNTGTAFQASGGQFTISGQPVLITTNTGSNANVTLSADGWGKIAINKPLTSTSNSNNISTAVGSVEVDSLFSVLATSSGQSAVTINQTGGGPLISASQSGTAKFTVDGSGNVTIASGSIFSVGTNQGQTLTNACVNTTGGIVTGTGTCPGGSGAASWWVQTGGLVYPTSSLFDFAVGGTSTSSALFSYTGIQTGQTIASVSGQLIVMPNNGYGGNATISGALTLGAFSNGVIQTTKNQVLTLGGNTTGNISLSPLAGAVGSYVAPSTNGQVDLGTATLQWRNIYAQNFISPATGIAGYWQRNVGALSPTNITDDLLLGTTATSTAQFSVSNIAKNQALASLSGQLIVMPNNGWGGQVGIGTTNPTRALDVLLNNSSTTAPGLLLEQTGTGDSTLELKNTVQSWLIGADSSDNSKLKISSSVASGATAVTAGYTTQPTGTNDSGNANLAILNKATPSSSGTVSSISVYISAVDPALPHMRAAIYSDSSGTPNTLLAQSANQTLTANSWNTFPLSANVTAGTQYWIGWEAESNNTHEFYDSVGGTNNNYYKNLGSYQAFPSTFTTPTAQNNIQYGVYMTYTPNSTYDSFASSLFSLGGTGQVLFQNSTDSIQAFQIKNAAGTGVLSVDTTSGNVGIGTTSPTALLDVAGAASVGGQLTFRSGTAQIQSTANQALTIGGATTGNITLSPVNNVAGGNVVPGATNVTDLGTSTLQWRNIYGQNIFSNGALLSQYWQRNLGTLAPLNITDDLLLGGIATSTAQFSVSNIAKNQALASLSGQLVVMPNNGWGGMIGIGTTNPTASLDVAGSASLSGDLSFRNSGTHNINLFDNSNLNIQNAGLGIVTVDAVGPTSAGTSCTGAGCVGAGALNWNHTVSGSNTLLVVSVALGGTITGRTVSVTYNGTSMNSAGSQASNNGTTGRVELFYLVNPTSGTHSVAVTLTGASSNDMEAGSISFNGVSQTSPLTNIVTNFGSSITPTVNVTSSTGSMVVDALVAGCTISSSGQTSRWINNQNCNTAGGNGAQSTAAGTGSVTMSYTISTDFWGIIGASINPASTSNSGTRSSLYIAGSNGNVGIGTTAPLTTLDVRGSSGTLAVASVSGKTSFATLVVDNSGVGDLITASKSGTPKFKIDNSGNIFANNLSTPGTSVLLGTGITGSTYNSGFQGTTNNAVYIGAQAGANDTGAGFANIYIGAQAGFTDPGNNFGDLFIGYQAGYTSNGNYPNTFIGYQSGKLSTCSGNTFIGYSTGASSTGCSNILLGEQAGASLTLANNNAFLGYRSGFYTTLGGNNTALGYQAGITNTVGGNNTFLGYLANSNVGNLINAGAIGANAYVTQNNSLILGSISGINGATASAMIGIGTTAPLTTLDVRGSSGTLAVASISGKTSFATLVVDNSGVGDLITASTSGVTQFKLTNTGSVNARSFYDLDNPLYFLDPAATATAGAIFGSVGIGTATPNNKLDVKGNIVATGYFAGESSANLTTIQATGTTGGNGNNGSIYFSDNSGNTKARVDTTASGSTTTAGTSADGTVSVSGTQNINTATLISGRSCIDGGDAVNYSASSLTSTTAVLSSTPSSGCLAAGDEVMLINLQGTSNNNVNVGNYETLTIQSVSTNTVTFTTAKTKFYGDGAANDTNIGTATTNQRVMLQRIPNYSNLTVLPGGTLTASAWNGTKGGVLFFRVSGTLDNRGTITMSGNGYRGGAASGAGNTAGTNGESYDGTGGVGSSGQAAANRGGGQGGAGTATASVGGGAGGGGGYGVGGAGGAGGGTIAAGDGGISATSCTAGTTTTSSTGGAGGSGCPTGAGGGGGGASSAAGGAAGTGFTSGVGGTTSNGAGGGAGGGLSGRTDLSIMLLGSGGGGGGNPWTTGAPTAGGNGGGIIYINANIVNSSVGGVSNNGVTAGNATSYGGGGGGGAGGSIYLNAGTATINSSLFTATGGNASGHSASYGGGGGQGGNGRIHFTVGTIIGSSNPTADTTASGSTTTAGTSADGTVSVSGTQNINTATLISGRSCIDGGDAVNYSASSLTSTTAVLSSTPSSGCLAAGDEVMLINLQGTSNNNVNVGNYETLTIQSVSTNTVTFTTAKTKFYGDGAANDTNIGTATTNQRVMLQRIPNYSNLTVLPGGTLTASAWNGTKGGVLFFRVSGTLDNRGTITMSGNGYRGGAASGAGNTAGTNGESYDGTGGVGSSGQAAANRGGGQGGAGTATASVGGGAGGGGGYGVGGAGGAGGGTIAAGDGGISATSCTAGTTTTSSTGGAGGSGCPTGAGGGGGGASSAAGGAAGTGFTSGVGGTTSNGAGGGAGGGLSGRTDLSIMLLGSGGGGGGNPWTTGAPTAGGNGGGIIYINANIVNSSVGGVSNNGVTAGNATSYGGGGGGGAGGSIYLNAGTATINSSLFTATGGNASGHSASYGGGGGQGGNGRIHFTVGTIIGSSNPTADTTASGSTSSYGVVYTGQLAAGITGGAVNTLDVYGGAAIGSYGGKNTAPTNGLIVSGNVGIGLSSPATALAVSGGNNINPEFPDGMVGTPVTVALTTTSTYTVPAGKTLYIINAANTDSGSRTLILNTFNIQSVAATSGNVNFGSPLPIASGTVISSSSTTANTFKINGFLVNTGVTPVFQRIDNTNIYTVPAGKYLFLVNAYNNDTVSASVRINALAQATMASGGSFNFNPPIIAGPGDIIDSSDTVANVIRIIGYLTKSDSSGGADLAEKYFIVGGGEPGDVISVNPLSTKNFPAVSKSTGRYDKKLMGIIATQPGIVLSDQVTNDATSGATMSIGMKGRVPTKVSDENGPILPGDYLTSSSIPGVAMKATEPGEVVGKALDAFDSSICTVDGADAKTVNLEGDFGSTGKTVCQGKVLTFINITYYDPNPPIITSLENMRNFVINTATNSAGMIAYSITDGLGNTVSRVEILAGAVIGNLQVGFANIQDLTTNNIISPIASIDQIHTGLISPQGSDSAIALKFENDKLSILNGNSASASAVSSFDNQGNATFSGSLEVGKDASIAGTLRAKKIIASEIEGLPTYTASNAATYVTNNYYASTPSASPNVSGISYLVSSMSGTQNTNYNIQNTGYIDIASYSGLLANVSNLNAATATFTQGLMSFGPSSFSDVSVVGQLSIDGNLILAGNSINVLGGDLQIQPLKQGGLSVMAGLFYIDTNGNVKVGGNAEFAKDVTVKGTLATNVISPIPGNDLTFKLATGSGILNTKYKIQDTSGSDILSINQQGDLIASGAGTFGKLNLGLVSPAFALSNTEVIATGSAGTASIRAYQTQITIDNPLVTEKSLIYITPKSSQATYLMRQVPGVSFTVGISTPSLIDVPFNWIIVN
ncbi:MAG: site-specific integrase [Patescibacteria group bacterium]|nr:site-specific integrase [Patescibacteria group bacterium]